MAGDRGSPGGAGSPEPWLAGRSGDWAGEVNGLPVPDEEGPDPRGCSAEDPGPGLGPATAVGAGEVVLLAFLTAYDRRAKYRSH